jgi:hypothetical protein
MSSFVPALRALVSESVAASRYRSPAGEAFVTARVSCAVVRHGRDTIFESIVGAVTRVRGDVSYRRLGLSFVL